MNTCLKKTDCKSKGLCNGCVNYCICHSTEYIKKVRNEDFYIKGMEKKLWNKTKKTYAPTVDG